MYPFICIPPASGKGPGKLQASTDVECDLANWDYNFMYQMGRTFLILILLLVLYLCVISWDAYHWQFGNRVYLLLILIYIFYIYPQDIIQEGILTKSVKTPKKY